MAGVWHTLDLSPVGDELRRLGLPGVPPGVMSGVASLLAGDLRSRAPERSGALRRSVEGRAEGETAVYGSPLPYASRQLPDGPSPEAAAAVAGALDALREEVFGGPA